MKNVLLFFCLKDIWGKQPALNPILTTSMPGQKMADHFGQQFLLKTIYDWILKCAGNGVSRQLDDNDGRDKRLSKRLSDVEEGAIRGRQW